MGFGIDLDREKPAPTAAEAPVLTYKATDGTTVAIDETAPGTARERAIARGLLLHSLGLLEAADRT